MKRADDDITSVVTEPTPVIITISLFRRLAENIESGTVAASDSDLTAAFKGTGDAARSAQATAEAWRDGELDLNPDLAALRDASTKAASMCLDVDPGGSYGALATGVS